MKRTVLSKTIGILGMLATLSAIVGTGIQQTAKAQEVTQSDLEFSAEQSRELVEQSLVRAIPDFCPALLRGDYSNLPPQFYNEEGDYRDGTFFGVEFTPELSAVVEQAQQRSSERSEALDLQVEKEIIPDMSINVIWKDPSTLTRDITKEILDGIQSANTDQILNIEQIDQLQEKYEQHAELYMPQRSLYTPEQFLEVQSIERELTATIATGFDDPDQLNNFLRNRDADEARSACTPQALKASETTITASLPAPAPNPKRTTPTVPEEPGKIIAIVDDNGRFNTLVAAIEAAGLTETLNSAGPYTVFVPTDAAFAALPEGILDKLLLPENKETLAKILTYHVVSGELYYEDLEVGAMPTVEGGNLTIAAAATGDLTVNGLTVAEVNIPVGNGVIHIMNEVLLPPDLDLSAL